MDWFETPLAGDVRGLPLRYYGDPVLRRKSEPIGQITDEIRRLAKRMIVTMHRDRGIGLAAPQVGYNLRLITLYTRTDDADFSPGASPGERLLSPMMPLALINPEITAASEETGPYEEGCLSIPGIQADVVRPLGVMLKARLLDGSNVHVECRGLLARCLQHEIDHLDGVLFVDRVSEEDARRLEPELRALRKRLRRRRLLGIQTA